MNLFTTLIAGIAFASTMAAKDAKAEALYQKLQDRLARATSISGTVAVNAFGRTDTYHFKYLRPNLARFVSKDAAFYQSGGKLYSYFPLDKEYTVEPAPEAGLPGGTAFNLGGIVGLESIAFPNEPKLMPSKLVKKTQAGKTYQGIVLSSPENKSFKAIVYLDPKSGLPASWTYSLQGFQSSGEFKQLVLNAPMKPVDFAFQPPKGAKLVKTN